MILARTRKFVWRWRIAFLILFIIAIVPLSGIRSWPDQSRGMRPGNKNEEFFRYLAQELAEPRLCEKISWTALLPGGFFTRESYVRSACYDFIAGRTKNPWLCWRVKRYGAFSLIDDQESMWSCLSHAFHGWNGGIAISDGALTHFFTEMGYDPDTLHLEGITPPVVSVRDIYSNLRFQPDILAQIEKATAAFDQAPNQTSADIEDAAYLDQFASYISKDSRWCFRIPQDLQLAGQQQKYRDWCLYSLATDTKNIEICRLIPLPLDGTGVRTSLQTQCAFQVNSPNWRSPGYVQDVPADDNQARRLLLKLNYQIPRAKDLPADQIEGAYGRFLDALEGPHPADPARAAARKRFIDRVMQLPNGG
jgi:hypothetical protein